MFMIKLKQAKKGIILIFLSRAIPHKKTSEILPWFSDIKMMLSNKS